jgi:hypothetical protein
MKNFIDGFEKIAISAGLAMRAAIERTARSAPKSLGGRIRSAGAKNLASVAADPAGKGLLNKSWRGRTPSEWSSIGAAFNPKNSESAAIVDHIRKGGLSGKEVDQMQAGMLKNPLLKSILK